MAAGGGGDYAYAAVGGGELQVGVGIWNCLGAAGGEEVGCGGGCGGYGGGLGAEGGEFAG